LLSSIKLLLYQNTDRDRDTDHGRDHDHDRDRDRDSDSDCDLDHDLAFDNATLKIEKIEAFTAFAPEAIEVFQLCHSSRP